MLVLCKNFLLVETAPLGGRGERLMRLGKKNELHVSEKADTSKTYKGLLRGYRNSEKLLKRETLAS